MSPTRSLLRRALRDFTCWNLKACEGSATRKSEFAAGSLLDVCERQAEGFCMLPRPPADAVTSRIASGALGTTSGRISRSERALWSQSRNQWGRWKSTVAVVQRAAGPLPSSPSAARFGSAAPRMTERASAEDSDDVEVGSMRMYRVTVETGDRRGAGTLATVHITLVGSTGASATLVVEGSGDEDHVKDGTVFPRGSKVSFMLPSEHELGQIEQVHVRRMNLKSELDKHVDHGWFLDRIVIEPPESLKQPRLVFPCQAWFGEDAEGVTDGVQERKLLPLRPGTEEQEGLAWPQLKEPLKARISAMVLPHMDKVAAGAKAVNRRSLGHGGEDAYFYTQADNLVGLGVADGVFMWRDQGIDSGEMSRALMESAKWAVEHGVNDPLLVLGNAWYKTYHRGVQGSSTATVLVADTTTGLLKSSLLGDSGYMIISKRPDLSGGARGRPQHGPQYVERFRSPQQEHQFGYPYQLGHHDTSDRPEDALNMRHRVGRGDVIVLGSDGLFDNVHTEEIVSCVNGPSVSKDGRLLPSAIAQELARIAFERSLDRVTQTPYSIAASEEYELIFSGGKKDDICVVVAVFD